MAGKIDIAGAIREVLDDNHQVSIHGLGSFRLRRIAASFGANRKSIKPPAVDLTLEATSSTNNELIKVLCRDYQLTRIQAQAAIQKYSEAILNALLNYKKVNLTGIALLVKGKNGELSVIPDKKFIGAYYNGLPELPLELKPSLSSGSMPELSATGSAAGKPVSDFSENQKKDRTELYPEHGYFPDPETKAAKPAVEEAAEMKEEVISPGYKPEVDPPWEPETKGTEWKTGWLIPLIGIGIILIAAIIYFKSCASDEAAIPVQETKSPDEKVAEAVFSDDTLSTPAMTDRPEYCIIITGSFASQDNVSRMIDNVRNAGYEVYTHTFGPYTRVGLQFQCADTDLESFIREIRTEISPRAWYLDPELYVAY